MSGCAPAIRSSRSDKAARCVSRARRMTCPTAKHLPLRSQHKIHVAGKWTASRESPREPIQRPKPQGQRSPTTTVPRSSEERAGTSAKCRSGTACRKLAKATHKHATRPQTLKGKQPQPAASPRPPAPRSSRHRSAKNGAGPAMRGAIADARKVVVHTNPIAGNRARQANVRSADVE